MDGALQEVNKCGKFQVCHVTLVQSCRFVSAWAFSVMIFGLYNPGWRCDERNSTLSVTIQSTQINNTNAHFRRLNTSLNSTTVPSHIRKSYNHDVMKLNSSDNKEVAYSYSTSCDAIALCDTVKFHPTSSTIVTEFGLVCDKVWTAYIIVSVLNCGMLLGAFVWGEVGERFGRKVGMYASCLTMTLSCGLAVLSPMWEVYAVFTFFIGFGAIGAVAVSTPLCMEFLDSKWRARLSSIPVWNMSIVCFALVTFILRDWRHIHLATTFICGVVCLGYFWTPESLRWLLIHNKTHRAKKVVDKMSKLNKLTGHSETLTHLVDTDYNADKNKSYSYLDLFRTRELCIITFKVGTVGVVLALVYDVIGFGIQALPGDFYTNLVIASLIEFPSTLSVGILANSIGRRWTGILFELIGIFCCATIVILLLAMAKCQTRDILVSSMAFINKASVQANLSFMMTYTTELVPTAVRNLTFGFCFTLSRAACIAGPYLLPRDYPSMVACFSVLVIVQLIAMCIFFSLPETKNRLIDDAIQKFDRNEIENDATKMKEMK